MTLLSALAQREEVPACGHTDRSDIERVKRGLATRRAEILARHAEELKALEADESELDAFEKAIATFARNST